MQIKLHKNAKTTLAVREEIRRARKSQRQALLEGRAHKLDSRAQLLEEKVTDSLQIADCFDALRSSNPYRAILIRGDAGFGSIDKIMLLLDLGYDFLLKGYSPHTARNPAQAVVENEWIPFNGATSVAELGAIRLPECRYPVRTVLGRSKPPRGESYQYFHLVTTIPEKVKSPIALLRFYNARQTIEAFIKTGKNVLNLKHFRVRNFYGIEFTLMLGLLAHNFMSWARRDIFAGTPLARMGIREFVEQAMRVPARVELLGMDTFITVFPETSLYAQALVQAIERKSSAQLALPFIETGNNNRVFSLF